MTTLRFPLTGPDAVRTSNRWRLREVADRDLPEGLDVQVCLLEEGPSAGVLTVSLQTDRLAVEVVPTRGMGIRSIRCDGVRFGWDSPVRGPVHPHGVPIGDPSGLGWLEGFDETVVRCGLESNGAPEFSDDGRLLFPLHGRIANQPAREVVLEFDPRAGRLRLSGIVDEARFLFRALEMTSTILIESGDSRVKLIDRVTNRSARETTIQLLYHINFGVPILEDGARAVIPAARVVPRDARAAEGIETWDRYGPPTAGFAEQVYFVQAVPDSSGFGHALLADRAGTRGAHVRFRTDTLPFLTLWKNTAALQDGYVTGLEPATNFPNPRSFERRHGRDVTLPPGGTVEFVVEINCLTESARVGAVLSDLEKLQEGTPCEICSSPRSDWCA